MHLPPSRQLAAVLFFALLSCAAAPVPTPTPIPTPCPTSTPTPTPALTPTPTPTPTSAPEGRPVTIGTAYTLTSTVLSEPRVINVYLPEGYKDAAKTFPVLYLLDGGSGEVGEDFHHITGLVALETQLAHTREAIVIGIADTDRKRDLTYPSTDPRDRAEVPTSGGSATFRKFIATELKPWVTSRFRASGESVVIGESLGGLFIVETFLREPKLFDGYIAISPSMWWDKGSLGKEAAARVRALPPGPRTLYLSIGDEPGIMRESLDTLVSVLKTAPKENVVWTFDPRPKETHGTIYQPAAQAGLRKLFALPKAAPKP